MLRWPIRTVAVIGGFAAIVTACGQSPSQVGGGQGEQNERTAAEKAYAKFAAMSGDARHDALVQAAKEEGEVVVYTSNPSLEESVAPAFEKKYGIDVQVYRAQTEQVRQRVLEEHRAGRSESDVVDLTPFDIAVLAKQGTLAQYKSDIRDDIRQKAPGHKFCAPAYLLAFAVVWNTDLVRPGEQPKSFEDLASPRWKGKLVMEKGDFNWYLTLYSHFKEQGMSDQQFAELFRNIAANATTVRGHVQMTSLLTAGEHAVAVDDYAHYVPEQQPKGAPIDQEPLVEPVVLTSQCVGLVSTAPHPAAAVLFTDYYLTEGQQAVVETGRFPTNLKAVPDYEPIISADVETVPVDVDEMIRSGAEWVEAYDNLLRGGDKVVP